MLDKKYNHLEVEASKYNKWLDKELFKAGKDLSKEPFCIVIPPPNVTGRLHLGHAWDVSIQDIIIRYKKMMGYDVLWIPGMDHAGIATQAKVDGRLKEMGIKPRELKRSKWLEYAWDWKEEYSINIREQWSKLGLHLDYSRERFTLDEGLNKAVNHVFIKLYEEGLIYRGERIINWDPEAMTALSNEEVIYKDVEGAFYHIKYFVEGSDEYLTLATTRPETMFGDTAVAVNPQDERYNHLVGKNVILPASGKIIPIIADKHADPEFGTGVVKITPAHDPNDFEVGNRHNLERLIVINKNGKMNENAGKYKDMDRFACREELIKELEAKGNLVKIEKMVHSVGHSERTDVMIEPYLSKQWFVKMRPLADGVLENQKAKDKKVNFVPKRFEKIMNHWMEITYDWCISRQLWWGHQIPAWYKDDEVYVGEAVPEGDDWTQDQDVLDTWFSSALWPFSTLGWPEESADFKRYYPGNVLVTGYDIIPFWVNRMTFQGLHFTGERPFEDCLIHGLIRDKEGRKMSKSLNNGIDPMDVIDRYGADSLRFFLTTATSPGQDLRFDEEKVAATWNFINKLWNASRFVLMKTEGFKKEDFSLDGLSLADKWILGKRNILIDEIKKSMDKYEFHTAGALLYDFLWNDYCDWYIELSKASESNTTKSTLLMVLADTLKMLSPFMPHVCDEIYSKLDIAENEFVSETNYPEKTKDLFNDELVLVEKIIADIVAIRNLKANNAITKESKIKIEVSNELKDIYFTQLKIKDENLGDSGIDSVNFESERIKISFSSNSGENKEALQKEIDNLKAIITKRESLLANESYISKAPSNIVEADRGKLVEEKKQLELLVERAK